MAADDAVEPLALHWPCAFPVPTRQQEAALLPALLPGSRRRWKDEEPRDYSALPPARRAAIAAAAAALGARLHQAVSLRSQMLKSAAPWKWHGTEKEAAAAAAKFECNVADFLLARGCSRFETQEAQLARMHAQGVAAAATPDFLLLEPARVNGAVCHWIEVKRSYGAGLVCDEEKHWLPSKKALKQLAKYVAAFGPGAVVFSLGFAEVFLERLPPGVLALDGSPFEETVQELFVLDHKI
jgi:hypothetical protein